MVAAAIQDSQIRLYRMQQHYQTLEKLTVQGSKIPDHTDMNKSPAALSKSGIDRLFEDHNIVPIYVIDLEDGQASIMYCIGDNPEGIWLTTNPKGSYNLLLDLSEEAMGTEDQVYEHENINLEQLTELIEPYVSKTVFYIPPE